MRKKPEFMALFLLFGALWPAPGVALAQGLANPDGLVTGYVNNELPTWLRLGGEERVRMEDLDGIAFNPAGNRYLLQRLRLNLDVAPISWLKFSFQAQDARVYFTNVSPAPSSQKDPMDLRVGYVQFGNPGDSPVSLRAGRQGLAFGEGRLLADPNWSNTGRTFDGVVDPSLPQRPSGRFQRRVGQDLHRWRGHADTRRALPRPVRGH